MSCTSLATAVFDPASGAGALYFLRPGGQGALPMAGSTLASILRDVPTLRLAVLNACESARASRDDGHPFAGVANALVLGGLPAVVAMQAPISDTAAIAFSDAFYRQLTVGAPIDTAVTEGRQAVHFAAPERREWSTPILFLRIPDGVLFRSARTEEGKAVAAGSGRRQRSKRSLLVGAAILLVVIAVSLWWWAPPGQHCSRADRVG